MPSLKVIVPAIALATVLGGAAIAADNTATSQPAANSGNTMSSPNTTSSSNTMSSSNSMSSSKSTMSKAKKAKKPASSTMSGQPATDSNATQGTNPH